MKAQPRGLAVGQSRHLAQGLVLQEIAHAALQVFGLAVNDQPVTVKMRDATARGMHDGVIAPRHRQRYARRK